MSASTSPPPPLITYSRSFLLSLYDSPLVLKRPSRMQPLSEWFGEFDPPALASPQNRHQHAPAHSLHATTDPTISSSLTSTRGSGGERERTSISRPNPFANFGRFGVDGGLEGTSASGSSSSNTIGGTTGGKRGGSVSANSRDSAPHLNSNSEKGSGGRRGAGGADGHAAGTSPSKYGTSPPSTNTFFTNERDRNERIRGGGREATTTTTGAAGRGDKREESKQQDKKEGRAEEGGWRTAGGDRDRRMRTSTTNANSNGYGNDSRNNDSRNHDKNHDSRSSNNRNDDRSTHNNDRISRANGGGSRPAWLDDETTSPASGTPAWMDAPATGTGTGGDNAPPVDGIQAWKAQMKEMERKEKAKEDEANGNVPGNSSHGDSIPETSSGPPPGLPIPSQSAPMLSPSSVANGPSTETKSDVPVSVPVVAAGGRSSRFAKFFDGKQPSASTGGVATTPTLEGLGSAKAETTSPADKESMSRLMGMLQGSGQRAPSVDAPIEPRTVPAPAPALAAPASVPVFVAPVIPIAVAAAPIVVTSPALSPPVEPVSNSIRARQGSSSGSRFAFSQPQPASTPSVSSSAYSDGSGAAIAPAPITLSHAQILQLHQQQALQHSLHQQNQLQQLQQQYPTNSAQQQLFLLQQQHFAAQQFVQTQPAPPQPPIGHQPIQQQGQTQQTFQPHTRSGSYSGTSPVLPQGTTINRGPQFFPQTLVPSHLQQLQQQHLQMHSLPPMMNARQQQPYPQQPYLPRPPPPLPPSNSYYPVATSFHELQQQRPNGYGRVANQNPHAVPQGQIDLMALLNAGGNNNNNGGGMMRGPPPNGGNGGGKLMNGQEVRQFMDGPR